MAEFDIRIGTQLDTSGAEEQLRAFINKYANDENAMNFKVNIQGEEKLDSLEKSLRNIKDLADSLKNMNINLGGLENVSRDISGTIESSVEEIKQATKGLNEKMAKSTKQSTKDTTEKLKKGIKDAKDDIDKLMKNLNDLKLNPFSDKDAINSVLAKIEKLKEISNMDIIGESNLSNIQAELEKVRESYSKIQNEAQNTALEDAFKKIKVAPLLEELQSVKEVMSAKNMDLSGIEQLENRMKDMKITADTLDVSMTQLKGIQNDLKTIKVAPELSGVKSIETAVKNLTKYKEELEKKITLEVDASKIINLRNDIDKVDEAIERLRTGAGSIGESVIDNLINREEIANAENMEKTYKKLSATLDKLKAKSEQLRGNEFVDISQMANIDNMIKDISQSMDNLKFDGMNTSALNIANREMKELENTIDSVVKSADKLKIEAKFNVDFGKAETQLNGLHASLLRLNGDTSSITELKQRLESISNLAKVDLSRATTELNNLNAEIKQIGNNNGFKNMTGDLNQYKSILSEITSLQSKLAKTSDNNFAESLKQEIDQCAKALDLLESNFDETNRKVAQGLRMDTFGQNFIGEVEKMIGGVDKLHSSLNSIGSNSPFAKITTDSGRLSEEFESLQRTVIELGNRMKTALEIGNIDARGVAEFKTELKQLDSIIKEFSSKTIDINCVESIGEINRLKAELDGLGESTADLDRLINKFEELSSAVQQGTVGIKEATKITSNLAKETSKISDGVDRTTRSYDAIDNVGRRISGTFGNIADSFRRFTIGELIEEGIENSIYAIKETIMGLDNALSEFKRVAPEDFVINTDNLNQVANQAREIGISVGQSVEDVITGMSTALQAGATTIEQASAIAEKSAILQNVTDMSAEKSAEAISAMVNQFYSMDTALGKVQGGVQGATEGYTNLENAIDLVNYAGNNFAISSEGVVEGLKNGGATLSAYGVSLQDTVAMLAGANELEMALSYSNVC